MRYKGLILLLLIVSFAFVAKIVVAGGKSEATELVPSSPVVAECSVQNGSTVVKIVAADDVSSLSIVAGARSFDLADSLEKGWSISRVFSGSNQSVTIKLIWRGSAEEIPVVCQ